LTAIAARQSNLFKFTLMEPVADDIFVALLVRNKKILYIISLSSVPVSLSDGISDNDAVGY